MKKIIIAITLLATMLSFSACGTTNDSSMDEFDAALESLQADLDDLDSAIDEDLADDDVSSENSDDAEYSVSDIGFTLYYGWEIEENDYGTLYKKGDEAYFSITSFGDMDMDIFVDSFKNAMVSSGDDESEATVELLNDEETTVADQNAHLLCYTTEFSGISSLTRSYYFKKGLTMFEISMSANTDDVDTVIAEFDEMVSTVNFD